MGDNKIGGDLSKWYIQRSATGRWNVCPPVNHDGPEWWRRGGSFATSAEAFVAYAAGADIANCAARTATPAAVEPWHGLAVTR